MAENLGKWPSKRGPISKIRPSDGCGGGAVLLALGLWYDFHEVECHLGNVGQNLMETNWNVEEPKLFEWEVRNASENQPRILASPGRIGVAKS